VPEPEEELESCEFEPPPGSEGAWSVTALVSEELISLAPTTAARNGPRKADFEVCPLAVISSDG
jgi:hypothetical protein